jgi:hypothetical protein
MLAPDAAWFQAFQSLGVRSCERNQPTQPARGKYRNSMCCARAPVMADDDKPAQLHTVRKVEHILRPVQPSGRCEPIAPRRCSRRNHAATVARTEAVEIRAVLRRCSMKEHHRESRAGTRPAIPLGLYAKSARLHIDLAVSKRNVARMRINGSVSQDQLER